MVNIQSKDNQKPFSARERMRYRNSFEDYLAAQAGIKPEIYHRMMRAAAELIRDYGSIETAIHSYPSESASICQNEFRIPFDYFKENIDHSLNISSKVTALIDVAPNKNIDKIEDFGKNKNPVEMIAAVADQNIEKDLEENENLDDDDETVRLCITIGAENYKKLRAIKKRSGISVSAQIASFIDDGLLSKK